MKDDVLLVAPGQHLREEPYSDLVHLGFPPITYPCPTNPTTIIIIKSLLWRLLMVAMEERGEFLSISIL